MSNAIDLARFHQGKREAMRDFYLAYFDTVKRAVGDLLEGADRETVVHEVFLKILSSEKVRLSFQGGSLEGWIYRIARNHALDFRERRDREPLMSAPPGEEQSEGPMEQQAELNLLVKRISESLPAPFIPLFEKRFLGQLNQRDAAAELGMSRTTLAKMERRLHAWLRRYLLDDYPPPGPS